MDFPSFSVCFSGTGIDFVSFAGRVSLGSSGADGEKLAPGDLWTGDTGPAACFLLGTSLGLDCLSADLT